MPCRRTAKYGQECAHLAKFSSATTEVTANSFQGVLAVLAGPSGWLPYLGKNVKTVQDNPSSFTFRVEPEDKFPEAVKALGLNPLPEGAVGVTDKQTGTILLLKKDNARLQGDIRAGRVSPNLLDALHECVHLVSDPVLKRVKNSHAHFFLGSGLLEGLVELIAEQVLASQKIALPTAGSNMLGHQDKVPISSQLLADVGIESLACLLFHGHIDQFLKRAKDIYGDAEWERIKVLADGKKTGPIAIQCMKQSAEKSRSRRAAKSFSAYKPYPGHQPHQLPWTPCRN